MFDQSVARMPGEVHRGILICRHSDRAIVGVVNINAILRGTFLRASLGYYVDAPFAGCGYMTHGLAHTIGYAVDELGLHRLGANIQPGNKRSLALVAACGFSREGSSRNFLYPTGTCRDHERWAIYDESVGLHPTAFARA